MNYNEWGNQYLEEAARLKEHLRPIREQAKTADNETAARLYRRIALLNEMYLECIHTGNDLLRHGGNEWQENQTSASTCLATG
ncbi:MAG: hypothetical protein GX424_05070 [Clostridiales bacterium]|jgi:hypothetical protein|nr:hypothetical protein [Clostridiales bacterium]